MTKLYPVKYRNANQRKCAIKHTFSFEIDGSAGTHIMEPQQGREGGSQGVTSLTMHWTCVTVPIPAYTAAGSAMKRARTERRMTVGIVKCCWNTGVLHNVAVSSRCLPSTSYRFLLDYVFSVSVRTCCKRCSTRNLRHSGPSRMSSSAPQSIPSLIDNLSIASSSSGLRERSSGPELWPFYVESLRYFRRS